MSLVHGAPPEAWDHLVSLGLGPDLLPVVSNPDAKISPQSTMQSMGKTPSTYNRDHKVVGLPKWTDIVATKAQIEVWAAEPDHGICLQTRTVRAIDIDVPNETLSHEIRDVVFAVLEHELPIRWRSDSGKMLLAFNYQGSLSKHVLQVSGGMVEILADGQQFVAFGRHPEGELYKWGGDKSRRGRPHEIPELTEQQLDLVLQTLKDRFGLGEWKIAREKRLVNANLILSRHDPVADWLNDNWETFDVGPDDQLFIGCPFAADHTTDSGPSSTAYFPAGTGGYSQGHFVCLHAHCVGRDDHDFLDATGYAAAQFEVLESPANQRRTEKDASFLPRDNYEIGSSAPPIERDVEKCDLDHPEDYSWPTLYRDQKGIEVSARNLMLAVSYPSMIKCHLAYDTFSDALMTREKRDHKWDRFVDADAIKVRVELEHRGFKSLGKELIRDCVAATAVEQKMDSAQLWLDALRWDGVERVNRFATAIWGWEDTPYATAVSRYVWTALAGRVLEPGLRADMAPILVGLQGARKTTLLQMMAPNEEWYTEVRLDAKDDDISRRLRGKVIGELEELRGLNSRALEEIKAFITRRKEAWVPKFKEFENFFWRRCIFFGTTNSFEFLADPTGERRWLPGRCGTIDVEQLIEFRDQYWAEGATMFAFEGLQWQAAEALAKAEHAKWKVSDTWELTVLRWLEDDSDLGGSPLDKGFVTIEEILTGALHIMPAMQNKGMEHRIDRALVGFGFNRHLENAMPVYRRG